MNRFSVVSPELADEVSRMQQMSDSSRLPMAAPAASSVRMDFDGAKKNAEIIAGWSKSRDLALSF